MRERFPATEIERYAGFIGESLKKTKSREYVPSQEEIAALLVRQEMSTTVYCHGGGSCKISINSHTTAGEVNMQTHAHTYTHTHFTQIQTHGHTIYTSVIYEQRKTCVLLWLERSGNLAVTIP